MNKKINSWCLSCLEKHKIKQDNNIDDSYYDELSKKYVHDIRNMNILNKEMMKNIYNMSHEQKMKIIEALNDMNEYLQLVVNKNDD